MTKKNITNAVKVVAAKSLASGLKAMNDSILGVVTASGKVGTSLESIALFMLASYGVAFFTEARSAAGKVFTQAWDDNYTKLVAAAPAGTADTIANQKSLYKGRLFRFAALAAKAQGKVMTTEQKEKAEELIKKYDSNASRKKGTPTEARSYKARIGDEVTAMYKFHMKADDFSGLSREKVENIGIAFETILRIVGIDPASVEVTKSK